MRINLLTIVQESDIRRHIQSHVYPYIIFKIEYLQLDIVVVVSCMLLVGFAFLNGSKVIWIFVCTWQTSSVSWCVWWSISINLLPVYKHPQHVTSILLCFSLSPSPLYVYVSFFGQSTEYSPFILQQNPFHLVWNVYVIWNFISKFYEPNVQVNELMKKKIVIITTNDTLHAKKNRQWFVCVLWLGF